MPAPSPRNIGLLITIYGLHNTMDNCGESRNPQGGQAASPQLALAKIRLP